MKCQKLSTKLSIKIDRFTFNDIAFLKKKIDRITFKNHFKFEFIQNYNKNLFHLLYTSHPLCQGYFHTKNNFFIGIFCRYAIFNKIIQIKL